MSSLTASLENLDQALDKLEKAFDYKLNELADKHEVLNNQLREANKKTTSAAKGLDDAIEKIEKIVGTKG